MDPACLSFCHGNVSITLKKSDKIVHLVDSASGARVFTMDATAA